MTLFAMISGAACVSYVYVGLLALLYDRTSKIHRSFAVLGLSFALWSFGSAGRNLSLDPLLNQLFDKITYAGAEVYAVSGAVFFLHLTGNAGKKRYQAILAVAAVPVCVLQAANWGWNLIALQFPAGFWHLAHHVAVNAINLFGLVLTVRWGMRSQFKRECIQARIIVSSTAVGMAAGFVVDYSLGLRGYPSLSSSLPLAWMVLICVAILRYGLMRFTPAQLSHEIISGIEEAVLLIDTGWRVSDLNSSALKLTDRESGNRSPLRIHEVFVRAEALEKFLKCMIRPESRTCSRDELLKTKSGGSVLVHADFHIITDKWGDLIGILCICRQKHDIAEFSRRNGLSRRESEILAYITSGSSQPEIADSLNLALPTVKTHTVGLYNKLGISNRTELFALLRSEL